MERSGLLTRRRDETNRRIHVVELTDVGREAFRRMRGAALGFNERLTRGFGAEDREKLSDLLDRLVANVGADQSEPTALPPAIGHGFGTVRGQIDPLPTVRGQIDPLPHRQPGPGDGGPR